MTRKAFLEIKENVGRVKSFFEIQEEIMRIIKRVMPKITLKNFTYRFIQSAAKLSNIFETETVWSDTGDVNALAIIPKKMDELMSERYAINS